MRWAIGLHLFGLRASVGDHLQAGWDGGFVRRARLPFIRKSPELVVRQCQGINNVHPKRGARCAANGKQIGELFLCWLCEQKQKAGTLGVWK